jgi:cupredoxin-like protein
LIVNVVTSGCGFVIVNISRFIKWLSVRRSDRTARSPCSWLAQAILRVLVPICILLPTVVAAPAAEAVTLTIKNHQFEPSEVSVPAGERFRIEVQNQDSTPAEFESADLRIEKIVVPGGKIAVMAGPLKPGVYKFFDDYHPDTAKGTLTAVVRKPQD